MLDFDYYLNEDRNSHSAKDTKEGEDEWRVLFDQYDHDGFGEIPIHLLSSLLKDGLNTGCISECDVNQILEKIGRSQYVPNEIDHPRATITFHRLTELRTRKRSLSFKCAIHERDGQVLERRNEKSTAKNDKDTTRIDIASRGTKLCNLCFRGREFVDVIAKEVLTNNTDFKHFNSRLQRNKCDVKGSALFLPIVSLLQVLIFIVQHVFQEELMAEQLEFRHYSPQEAWRFLSYGVLYSNTARLVLDVGRQLTVGIALELVYGPWRVAVTFVTAVFSASLVVSLFAPNKSLRGSSAGANSLVVSLLVNWILHKTPSNIMWMKMVALIMFTSLDLGFTIFENEASEEGSGYIPFTCGLATGITLGYTVLSTYEQNLTHQRRWWLVVAVEAVMLISLFVYVLLGKNKRFII